MGATDAYEDADRAIVRVITWYTERIAQERANAHPDEERIQGLTDARDACVSDRHGLLDLDDDGAARVALDYAVTLEDLTGGA